MKPFRKLRHALDDADISREDIERELGKSATYVGDRFRLKHQWSLEDAYTILEMLEVPPTELPEFFPRGGY